MPFDGDIDVSFSYLSRISLLSTKERNQLLEVINGGIFWNYKSKNASFKSYVLRNVIGLLF